MLIYIHGFNSGSASGKARLLQAYMAERGAADACLCPDLPHRPAAAIALLTELAVQYPQATFIGSSLGGFYATWLTARFGVKSVLINPAVHAHVLLAGELGEQTNFSTGEVYQFTSTHIDELAALDLPIPAHADKMLLMVETGDAVLDYRDAVAYYHDSRQVVVAGGNHNFLSFPQHIATIVAF
ncbi:MAG: esterase [Sulfuriferula sp.]|nr:esterase [Sulfuriferula sp.]